MTEHREHYEIQPQAGETQHGEGHAGQPGIQAHDRPPTSERTVGGHDSHAGRPRSWVLVGVVIAAFCAGAVAIIGHVWWLFWVCVGIVVLAIPVGKLIGIMDDTVMVGGTDPERERGG